MKRKDYQKPTMRVVKLQRRVIICASEVGGVNNNANMRYRGSDDGYEGDVR